MGTSKLELFNSARDSLLLCHHPSLEVEDPLWQAILTLWATAREMRYHCAGKDSRAASILDRFDKTNIEALQLLRFAVSEAQSFTEKNQDHLECPMCGRTATEHCSNCGWSKKNNG